MRSKRSRSADKSEDEEEVIQVPNQGRHNSRTRRASQASAKAMKEINPVGTFVRGNIIRIVMKDFLTFSNTIVKPGPRLNLIIGPNGTGKSSIVNAVCIVFGGKLALLGRGGDLPSFVRHGARESTVEVWVHDPEVNAGYRKVKRIFDIEGSSTFYIDGKTVTAKAMAQLARDYDVQLDNLSQFMPQEKIADFVSIKPPEMLTITVRSLGGTQRVESLTKLREQDILLRKEATTFGKRQDELDGLRQRNEEMRSEVAAFKKQKDLKKKVLLAQRILPHREADELRQHLLELLNAKTDAEQAVKEVEEKLRTIEKGTLRQLDLKRRAAKQEVNADKLKVRVADSATSKSSETIDTLDVAITSTQAELANVDRMMEKRLMKLRAAEQKVKDCDNRIANMGPQSNEQEDQRLIDQERVAKETLRNERYQEEQDKVGLEQKISSIQSKIKHIQNDINNLSDVRTQRLRALERHPQFRNTIATYDYVSKLMEEGKFTGNIFGPLALEISCQDHYHARILESCVSGWLMGAYVAENSADARILRDECKKGIGYTPDVITAVLDGNGDLDHHALSMQVPRRPVDARLRELGIVATVPEIFQAHDSVRSALNAVAQLQHILVGDANTESNTDQLKAERGVKVWYTPNTRVQVVTSRYDRNARNLKMDTRFKDLRGHMYHGSSEEMDNEKQQYDDQWRAEEHRLKETQAKWHEVNHKIQDINARIAEVDQRTRDVYSRIRNRQRHSQDRENAVQEYRRLQERKVDDSEEKKVHLRDKILHLERKIVEAIPETVKNLTKLQESMKGLDEAVVKRADAEKAYADEEGKNSAYENELSEAEGKLETARAEAKQHKVEWKRKRQEADRAITQDDIEKHIDIVRPWFEHDAAWLEGEIERLTGRIQGLATSGPNVLRDYEEREKRIEDLERKIGTEKENHEIAKHTFEADKTEFLGWLKQGVEYMRQKFSELYSRFGCAGDLELYGIESIEELELRILVSYREGAEMRPISATSNSGGEKMCCTMLFCFSLLHDHARMPPFVIVDELNQGLDPSNEMEIMKIMFVDAERGTAPQSFVVTPKLLAGLPFQEAAKTHVIFNGKVQHGNITAHADL